MGRAWGLAEVLGAIGDDRAGDVLVRALAYDGSVSIAAANGLVNVRNARAVGPLMDLIVRTKPNGTFVKDMITSLLGYSPDVKKLVRRFRNEPSEVGRRNLLQTIARHPDSSVELFLEAATDDDDWIRWAAIEGIVAASRRSGARIPETWVETLAFLALDEDLGARHMNTGVTWRAVEALHEVCALPEWIPQTSPVTLSPEAFEIVVRSAERSVGAFGPQIAERLAQLAQSEDGVRFLLEMIRQPGSTTAKAHALDLIGPLSLATPLRRAVVTTCHGLLSDENQAVRLQARAMLLNAPDDVFLEAADHPTPDVFETLVWITAAGEGMLGPQIVERLTRFARTGDGVKFLLDVVQDSPSSVARTYSFDLLDPLSGSTPLHRSVVSTCHSLLADDDPTTRRRAAELLLGARFPWHLRMRYRKQITGDRKSVV